MSFSLRFSIAFGSRSALAVLLLISAVRVQAEPVVPGTGEHVTKVGDDFEDPTWKFIYNAPKSSENIDKQVRPPGGASANGRWYEGALRGQPDVIQRVETPPGGLPGSKGALLIKTMASGVPGSPSYTPQQDDLLLNVDSRIGGPIPVSWSPSVVVRVYLPPFDEWEKRTGNSFGFRAGVRAPDKTTSGGFFKRGKTEPEPYWPGMFIHFYSKADKRNKEDSAVLVVRADERGLDFLGPKITQPGWWTLGMSFTPDGMVHYYAHAGVEDLSAADLIASKHPYGFRCERLQTFFFNVISPDDGKTWSTDWIIDDPALYYNRR